MRFALFLISAAALLAQTGTGVVRGTVQDNSRSIISNAKVGLLNRQMNTMQAATTSAEGLFQFGSLPPAPYTLTVEAPGFKKSIVPKIKGSGANSRSVG